MRRTGGGNESILRKEPLRRRLLSSHSGLEWYCRSDQNLKKEQRFDKFNGRSNEILNAELITFALRWQELSGYRMRPPQVNKFLQRFLQKLEEKILEGTSLKRSGPEWALGIWG
ncbi:hypothetical protein Tco_1135948 [Tanacetum coccineum]